jgi:ketopantoate hydroxymethyltransferase
MKKRGEKWAMLTSYEQMTAEIFDEAQIPVLLVGDSAGNNFLGEENTIPVTVDELIPLARAVVRSTSRAMVVADFPFGSYESGPDAALATVIRFFKEEQTNQRIIKSGIMKHLVSKGLCSRPTAYRIINKLIDSGILEQEDEYVGLFEFDNLNEESIKDN